MSNPDCKCNSFLCQCAYVPSQFNWPEPTRPAPRMPKCKEPMPELKHTVAELKQREMFRVDSTVPNHGLEAAYHDGVMDTLRAICKTHRLGDFDTL